METLVTQILVKNHEKTIKSALESVAALNGKIVIADLGSEDGTIKICKNYTTDIFRFKSNDRGQIRNQILKDNPSQWHFYLEPWERLIYGIKEVMDLLNSQKFQSYFFNIFRGKTITKEIRLWSNNLLFSNPIYEYLDDKNASYLNGVIYSKAVKDEEIYELIKEWRRNSPMSAEPHYYEACFLLSNGNYEEFLKTANLYLFKDNHNIMPVTMLRYYCALVYCCFKKDARFAIRYLIPCIIANPLMAEFWCLLGDIYYELMKDYKKAFAFYDNAILLGSKRLKSDLWPMEIEKYKDYPSNLKKICKDKISTVKTWGLIKT